MKESEPDLLGMSPLHDFRLSKLQSTNISITGYQKINNQIMSYLVVMGLY